MRPVISSTVLTGFLTPLLLIVPVASPTAVARPHPVRASAEELTVRPVDGARERVGAVLAQLDPGRVAPFKTIGASWAAGSVHAGQQVEVRTRARGHWSAWAALAAMDTAADTGSADDLSASSRGRRVVAEPVYVGAADGVQARLRAVRAVGVTAAVPSSLNVVLIDPGTSAADRDPTATSAAASSAFAGEPQPAVRTRAQWGADESLRTFNSGCGTPSYSATIKVGFVHHTDTPNNYAPADVPGMLRGIYAYHVKTQGWCDIGYNFLVDRFGVVWEGRYGGIARPVLGAHTGGFNKDSFAASLLGTYATVTPSDATIAALDHLYAWKLGLHYRDPLGTVVLTSAGGPNTKYALGTQVSFNTISGHRDVGNTTCPGDAAYSQLPRIRTEVRSVLGSGLVNPGITATATSYGGTGPTVTAGVLQPQHWQLELRQRADGTLVRSWSGSTSTTLAQGVELKDGRGVVLAPGGYTLVLSSAAGADPALSWTSPFDIVSPLPPPGATGSGAPGLPGDFVAVTPTRLLDTRSGVGQGLRKVPVGPKGRVDLQVTGVGGVPTGGVTAVAINVTGVHASQPTFLTVFPADSAQAGTSTVNLVTGETRASLVLPRVGPDGRVSIANEAGALDVLADIVGYYRSDTPANRYHAIVPRRLLDTRRSGSTRLARETAVTVAVAGIGDVPAGATGVTLNITAVHPAADGFLTASPSAAARATTSTVNYVAGQVVANRAVTGLANGSLSVFSGASACDVLVDVVGWFGPADSAGQQYTALTPTRVFDTRRGTGGPAGPASTTVLPLAGQAGLPADAKAVVLTLTGTASTAETFLTVWAGGVWPGTSDVNLPKGATVANLAVVPMAADGSVSIYNAGGSTHVVADVLGYYR